MLVRLACLWTLLLVHAFAYPSGAPLSRCGSMMPGHGYEPLPGEKPYQIVVKPISKRSYEVTIYSDTDRFKGFLIEARTDADEEEAIGVWTTEVPHTKTLNCFDSDDSAVTHHYDDDYESRKEKDDDEEDADEEEEHNSFRFRDRRSDDYSNTYSEFEGYDPHKKSFSNVTLTWQAPSTWRKHDDKIVFIATVVQKFNRIYTNVTTTLDLPKRLKYNNKHHGHHHYKSHVKHNHHHRHRDDFDDQDDE